MKHNSFKNRKINKNKPVEMYRCLNRKGKVFSIRQGGLVVGHTIEGEEFSLVDCQFVVNRSGKRRSIREQQRNVHAFIKGYVAQQTQLGGRKVSYNPFSKKGFTTHLGEINSATVVTFTDTGVYCKP